GASRTAPDRLRDAERTSPPVPSRLPARRPTAKPLARYGAMGRASQAALLRRASIIGKGGPFCTPIRGPVWTPIDSALSIAVPAQANQFGVYVSPGYQHSCRHWSERLQACVFTCNHPYYNQYYNQ